MANPIPDDELKRLAVVGTGHGGGLAGYDNLIGKETRGDESRLLLTAATVSLRGQAGFLPGKWRYSASEPCEADTLSVMSWDAAKHLLLMLDSNHHVAILPEFCVHTGATNQRAPEEFLPILLDKGHAWKPLRKYLGFLLGQRGIWLAQERGNKKWAWALDLQYEEPKNLLRPDASKEAPIIRSLVSESIDTSGRHYGLVRLQNHHTMWSETLTQAFIQALVDGNGILNFNTRYDLKGVLQNCGIYCPVSYGDAWLRFLDDYGVEALDLVRADFDFRKGALEALDAGYNNRHAV